MARIGYFAFCFQAVISIGATAIWTGEVLTNIALRKNILVSNISEHESSLAVDGITNTSMADGFCINIETDHVWWQLDLGDMYTIFHIRIIPTEHFHNITHFFERKGDCYEMYEGQTNTTISGRTCQRWDFPYPHIHRYSAQNFWSNGNVSTSENYCRAPSGGDSQWCYTTDHHVRYEHCDIIAEECIYEPIADIKLKTGVRVDDLVNTDYTGVNDKEQTSWELILKAQTQARFVEMYQNISFYGYYQLCEVEIYGTKETLTNVALHKNAKMSSVNDISLFGPDLAVDGILDQRLSAGSCFQSLYHDDDPYPWWHVDLGGFYMVVFVRIYNTVECCSKETPTLTLSLWGNGQFHFNLISKMEDVQYFYTDKVLRFLELSSTGSIWFNLCEVEVFGKEASECQSNPCLNGGNCTLNYCDNPYECIDYRCTCQAGYGGVDCKECVENIALGTDILSSSFFPRWLLKNAVDGDTNQYVVDGAKCTSIGVETNPYLIIDLGVQYTLTNVKVYKRLDCCPGHFYTVELFLMMRTWTRFKSTSKSRENISTFDLDPYVSTSLVRVQAEGEQPTYMQLCEIQVFALCHEEDASTIPTTNDQTKPFIQMRFSLSDKYNDVVKTESSFIDSLRHELSHYTGYSVDSFQNMQLEKEPFHVSFELHSTNGDLQTLNTMIEEVDELFKTGEFEIKTEDSQKLSVTAGSLKFHIIFLGNSGARPYGALLMVVGTLFLVIYLP